MCSAMCPMLPRACSRPQNPIPFLITAAVHRLVSGLSVVEDRGARQPKGIEPPIHLYRAIQPTAVRRRMHDAAAAP